MGLNMSPKVERQSAADSFALEPAPASANPIVNNVIETPRVARASFVAPTVAFVGGAATQDAKGIACSSTMQWGFTRDLPTSMQERREALLEIQTRHDATCALCQKNKSNIVAGQGNPMAELFLIAEAPGENEQLAAQPFAGKSGDKLNEMLNAMGLKRESIFMSYVLKSRPPNDRPPTQLEVDQCGPYLLEQLLVIRPKVIVSFGGPASKLILAVDEGITLLRGKWATWSPPKNVNVAPILVMPTFHPAYVLRNYTQETRSQVWSDLQMAMSKLTPPIKM